MKGKIVAIVVAMAMVCSLGLSVSLAVPAQAATPQEIEDAVSDGVAWLAGEQNGGGSWGSGDDMTAQTAFALIKLQERAYDLGYPSPFDASYEYSDEIVEGWGYIFDATRTLQQTPLPTQNHTAGASGTMDNPDTNGNGYGVYFQGVGGSHPTYTTGICLMALAASGTPGRANDGGLDFDGDTNPDTFGQMAQDAVDWLAFGQGDLGTDQGGWDYGAINNAAVEPDQSNSGYAVLGLAAGEGFGCTVPGWVRTELNVWIGTMQDTSGGTDDGGSWYEPDWSWVNELKTGNLIFQMAFYGDDTSMPYTGRFAAALAYIERHWHDVNIDPGWGYNSNPACYQAMYCLMKGLVYSGVDWLDLDGDTVRDNNWFNQEPPLVPPEDFASFLVAQQLPGGSWNGGCNWGSPVLCTVWALLTLEKISPPPPPPVGGEVYPISAFGSETGVSPLWVGLGVVLILAAGGGVLVLRHRRAHQGIM